MLITTTLTNGHMLKSQVPSGPLWESMQTPIQIHGHCYCSITGPPDGYANHLSLTQHADPVPVCGVGPAHWGDGDGVMAEVHKDVDVLPVVEGVGILHP